MTDTADSPSAVFARAAEAMRRGDWPTVVRCLRKKDVLSLLLNSVPLSWSHFGGTPELAEIHARYGFEMPSMDDLRTFRQRLKDALKTVKDPAGLLGELEQANRTRGGGSLSSGYFIDEQLRDVEEDGSKARGTRVCADGQTEPLEFVKEAGAWRISLLARPR